MSVCLAFGWDRSRSQQVATHIGVPTGPSKLGYEKPGTSQTPSRVTAIGTFWTEDLNEVRRVPRTCLVAGGRVPARAGYIFSFSKGGEQTRDGIVDRRTLGIVI